MKRLLKPKTDQKQQNQRNLIQEQIQRTKNLREQNLRSQQTTGTVATVQFEEIKVKVSQMKDDVGNIFLMAETQLFHLICYRQPMM